MTDSSMWSTPQPGQAGSMPGPVDHIEQAYPAGYAPNGYPANGNPADYAPNGYPAGYAANGNPVGYAPNGNPADGYPAGYAPNGNPAGYAPGTTAEQLDYQRGQQDAVRRLTTPRMTGWRVTCGICWAFWTVVLTVSAFASLGAGNFGAFLVAAVLAGLAGWYDYRIWALKARRLTLFIIF